MRALSDEIERRVGAAAIALLQDVGQDLAGRAARDAPIQEGTLRGSAASRVELTPFGAQAVVSFSTPYAAVQHERRDFHHPRGGKAGYLGDNLKAMTPAYVGALGSAVAKAMRGL